MVIRALHRGLEHRHCSDFISVENELKLIQSKYFEMSKTQCGNGLQNCIERLETLSEAVEVIEGWADDDELDKDAQLVILRQKCFDSFDMILADLANLEQELRIKGLNSEADEIDNNIRSLGVMLEQEHLQWKVFEPLHKETLVMMNRWSEQGIEEHATLRKIWQKEEDLGDYIRDLEEQKAEGRVLAHLKEDIDLCNEIIRYTNPIKGIDKEKELLLKAEKLLRNKYQLSKQDYDHGDLRVVLRLLQEVKMLTNGDLPLQLLLERLLKSVQETIDLEGGLESMEEADRVEDINTEIERLHNTMTDLSSQFKTWNLPTEGEKLNRIHEKAKELRSMEDDCLKLGFEYSQLSLELHEESIRLRKEAGEDGLIVGRCVYETAHVIERLGIRLSKISILYYQRSEFKRLCFIEDQCMAGISLCDSMEFQSSNEGEITLVLNDLIQTIAGRGDITSDKIRDTITEAEAVKAELRSINASSENMERIAQVIHLFEAILDPELEKESMERAEAFVRGVSDGDTMNLEIEAKFNEMEEILIENKQKDRAAKVQEYRNRLFQTQIRKRQQARGEDYIEQSRMQMDVACDLRACKEMAAASLADEAGGIFDKLSILELDASIQTEEKEINNFIDETIELGKMVEDDLLKDGYQIASESIRSIVINLEVILEPPKYVLECLANDTVSNSQKLDGVRSDAEAVMAALTREDGQDNKESLQVVQVNKMIEKLRQASSAEVTKERHALEVGLLTKSTFFSNRILKVERILHRVETNLLVQKGQEYTAAAKDINERMHRIQNNMYSILTDEAESLTCLADEYRAKGLTASIGSMPIPDLVDRAANRLREAGLAQMQLQEGELEFQVSTNANDCFAMAAQLQEIWVSLMCDEEAVILEEMITTLRKSHLFDRRYAEDGMRLAYSFFQKSQRVDKELEEILEKAT